MVAKAKIQRAGGDNLNNFTIANPRIGALAQDGPTARKVPAD
jgi:hypothetical protein